MIPESQFLYRRIGEALFDEIVNAISQKQRSHVLLGARNSGKRYIMHRLPERLLDGGVRHVVTIDFHRDRPWESEKELTGHLQKCFGDMAPANELTASDGTLRRCLERAISDRPGMVLLASGIDDLGPHLSLLFVQVIRTFVQASSARLTVVLTGEVNFQDLVDGPGSAFENCAQQIVIQGYDQVEFSTVARTRANSANITLNDKDARRLFRLTGGQFHLLTPLLSAWQDFVASHAAQQNREHAQRVFFSQIRAPGDYGLELLEHAADLIGQYPNEWARLEGLIQRKNPSAGFNPPGPLEFAGLAVRDGDDRLHFCSPLIARSVRRYFHDRRRGDWHAQVGRWTEALQAYEGIEPTLRLRPSGPDDRPVIWSLIRSYGSYLYSLASLHAHKAPQQRLELRIALQRGLQLILGVRSVTFWRRGETKWHSLTPAELTSPSSIKAATKFLPSCMGPPDPLPQSGWIAIPSPKDQEYLVALIASERDDQPEALVITESGSGHVLTRERQNLVRELGNVFLRAYEHLSSVARAITRGEQRQKFGDVAATALSGTEMRKTPADILRYAGEALLTIGYKRLLFSLLDPSGSRIKGEVDVSSNDAVNVAEHTDYPADKPESDIQAWVLHHRQPRRVAQPLKEPGVNRDVVERANIGPFALLPLLGQNGEALGTLHVEREDCSLPTREEVDDFIAFGRRLSVAIERCERVALYQPALQLLRDPVFIIDPLNRIRFANEAAHTEFDVHEGWQERREAQNTRHVFGDVAHSCVLDLITTALEKEQRSVRYLPAVGKRKRRMTVVAQPIPVGSRYAPKGSQTQAGVLLHFRDYHYQWTGYDVLNNLNEVITVRGYLDRLLELPKALGHKWARLWLTPEVLGDDLFSAEFDQSRVIGVKSYHNEDPELNSILQASPEPLDLDDPESARAVRDGQVVIYQMVTTPTEKFTTPVGLEVIPFTNPPRSKEFKRKVGEKWINFPLRSTEGKMIGMISMDVPDHFRARNVEDLKMMAQIIGARLTSLLESRFLKAASERVIADVSHEIITRLTPLQYLVSRCDLLATENPRIKDLGDDLAGFAVSCLSVLKDIKGAYLVPPVERQTLDLRDWLRRLVAQSGWGKIASVMDGEPIEAQADPGHLERALVELLKNAGDFARPGVALRIEIDTGLKLEGDQQMVWITVRDNGKGIPKAKWKLVFTDFYSYRPGQEPSTGMGLAGVERQIKALGGTISVGGFSIEDSSVSAAYGAVFRLTWPNISCEIQPHSTPASASPETNPPY
jgi:signal transduction histidine kinase/PAS domain-containing protein